METKKILKELNLLAQQMSISYPNKANFLYVYKKIKKLAKEIKDAEYKYQDGLEDERYRYQDNIEDNGYYPDEIPFINNNKIKC